jgi:hypothetical protein
MDNVLIAFEKKNWKGLGKNMSKVKMRVVPDNNEFFDDFQKLFSEAVDILNRLEQ